MQARGLLLRLCGTRERGIVAIQIILKTRIARRAVRGGGRCYTRIAQKALLRGHLASGRLLLIGRLLLSLLSAGLLIAGLLGGNVSAGRAVAVLLLG